jgi:hypothetical protein
MKTLVFAVLRAATLHANVEGHRQGYYCGWGHLSRQLIALAEAMPAEKFAIWDSALLLPIWE